MVVMFCFCSLPGTKTVEESSIIFISVVGGHVCNDELAVPLGGVFHENATVLVMKWTIEFIANITGISIKKNLIQCHIPCHD